MRYFVFVILVSFIFIACKDQADIYISDSNFIDYKKDTARFIAHAGGRIDGNNYTNSLEALNLSYQKGFRLFELDLIVTSDSQIVAFHDWEMWRSQNKYLGEVPVSKEVFLETKILSKYTPLSLDEINHWFQTHKEAVLVTDKLNKPSLIANTFVDKNRLMMELFSLEAIKEAQSLGVKKVMASPDVLNSFGDIKVEKLKENNIEFVTFSRNNLLEYGSFLKDLKKNGVKTYVYNLTDEKDEDYVLENEMEYTYGFYADNWKF